MEWSVESLPSNPSARVRFPADLKFHLNRGTGCVSFFCVLSCVVSGSGPDISLTKHLGRSTIVFLSSVLIHSLSLPPQAFDPLAIGL